MKQYTIDKKLFSLKIFNGRLHSRVGDHGICKYHNKEKKITQISKKLKKPTFSG